MEPSPSSPPPTPQELHNFLAAHYFSKDAAPATAADATDQGRRFLNPGEPANFWTNVRIPGLPFTDGFVLELRQAYRKHLIALPSRAEDELYIDEFRTTYIPRSLDGDPPTARDLFQVAGMPMTAGQRLSVCMRLAGVNQTTVLDGMDLNEAEENKLRKEFSAFLNHPDRTFSHLKWVCDFLDLSPTWIMEGPLERRPLHEPLSAPWWLIPWLAVCEVADLVFAQADRRGLLPYRDQDRAYDFGAFWSRWREKPDLITLPIIDTQLLPWIFEASGCFRCGHRTYNVPLTPQAYQVLRRMIASQLQACNRARGPTAELPPDILVPVEPPAWNEIAFLLAQIDAPPRAGMASGPRIVLRTAPVVIETPGQLDSRVGKVNPGRKPGSARNKTNPDQDSSE